MFSANNITLRSKKKYILNHISFKIQKGEIFGIVGKNGAGKSTLLKIVSGQLIPSDGELKYMDSRIGFLIEEPSLYRYKTGLDQIEYYLKINKCSDNDKRRILQYVSMLDAEEILNKKIKNYSQGMKQKLGILTALVGNPSLIILDEPANSLDYTSIIKLRELLLHLKSKGFTIIVTSHILTEIEKICDRVLIINEGKVVKNLVLDANKSLLEEYLLEDGNIQ